MNEEHLEFALCPPIHDETGATSWHPARWLSKRLTCSLLIVLSDALRPPFLVRQYSEKVDRRSVDWGEVFRVLSGYQNDRLSTMDWLHDVVGVSGQDGKRVFPGIGLGVLPYRPNASHAEGLAARDDELHISCGVQAIKATVPLSNMFGYAIAMRGSTQGRANFSMEASHPSPQSMRALGSLALERRFFSLVCNGRFM
jgi:Elongation factor G C-terminus